VDLEADEAERLRAVLGIRVDRGGEVGVKVLELGARRVGVHRPVRGGDGRDGREWEHGDGGDEELWQAGERLRAALHHGPPWRGTAGGEARAVTARRAAPQTRESIREPPRASTAGGRLRGRRRVPGA